MKLMLWKTNPMSLFGGQQPPGQPQGQQPPPEQTQPDNNPQPSELLSPQNSQDILNQVPIQN
jgi:hypothetical protein